MIRAYRDSALDQLLAIWHRASLLTHPFLSQDFLAHEREKSEPSFVEPALHGQGIGRALMDHARSLRTRLEVEVFKDNPIGRGFYTHYGFEFGEEHLHEESNQWLLRLILADD